MTETTAQDSGQTFLEDLFEHLEMSVSIDSKSEDGESLVYEITGDIARLKRSPDLVSAITLLTSQAASRASGERASCLLDVGGTFEARRALLATAAEDISRAVAATGRRAVIDSLSSSERRIVHTHLRDDDAVASRSEGEERGRLLIVERT